MSVLGLVFILGCFVSALVALGIVFSVSALGEGTFGGFEGRAADDQAQ